MISSIGHSSAASGRTGPFAWADRGRVHGPGIALQLLQFTTGMRLVAVANRHLDGAAQAYREAGVADVRAVEKRAQLEGAIARGHT